MFSKGEIQAWMILDVFDKIGTSKSLGSWRDAAQSVDGDSGDKIDRLGSAFRLSPMQECLRLATLQDAGQGEEPIILVVLNVFIISWLTSYKQ